MTTAPHRCLHVELAAARLDAAPAHSREGLMATLAAVHMLHDHCGWMFPDRVSRRQVTTVLGAERRWHGVVVQGAAAQ